MNPLESRVETSDIKELYSNELFDEWAEREQLMTPERYLLTKYLTDSNKRVIEGGTGGGRLIFFAETLGFKDLDAFDFVPEFIERAKEKADRRNSAVRFVVADACNLHIYRQESFDYLVYLQQMLSSLPENLLARGIDEASRVARKGAIAIFSFLHWDSRTYNSALSFLVNAVRRLRGERVSRYYLPYLKLNARLNFNLLARNAPSVLWTRRDDIISQLKQYGFETIEVITQDELGHKNTALYIVCKKA